MKGTDETPAGTGHGGDDRVEHGKARWVRENLERFEGSLLLYATRILRDSHAAQDVVQEAFLRLLDQDPDAVGPRLPGWLFAVCRNLAVDRKRRERIMERTNAPALDGRTGTADDPAARAARNDEAAAVLRALDRLPEKQREALVLRFRHGLSYRDIAEAMDLTVNHVGVLLHHGLRALRAEREAPAAAGALSLKGAAR